MILPCDSVYLHDGTTTMTGIAIFEPELFDYEESEEVQEWKALSNEIGRKVTGRLMDSRSDGIVKPPITHSYQPRNYGKQDRHGFRNRNG